MSGRTPGDKAAPTPVEATLDDLPSVDTKPVLEPVAALTLDEEPPPEPSATQLLNPVEDAPTDPKLRPPRATSILDVSADGPATVKRKRVPLKADAFESFASLPSTRHEKPRGPPGPWQKPAVWTPGLVALTLVGVLLLLVVVLLVLHG